MNQDEPPSQKHKPPKSHRRWLIPFDHRHPKHLASSTCQRCLSFWAKGGRIGSNGLLFFFLCVALLCYLPWFLGGFLRPSYGSASILKSEALQRLLEHYGFHFLWKAKVLQNCSSTVRLLDDKPIHLLHPSNCHKSCFCLHPTRCLDQNTTQKICVKYPTA